MDDLELPGYDVEALLGVGGSGEVWRAREHATGELVALKRLHTVGTGEGLAREAALLATVRHEHVIGLRGVVPYDDGLVLVLEFAEGGSLAALLAGRGRLTPGEVVTIGAPLAQALSDIHARGLVHGDITPANVLFDGSGKPLLADLGVASLAGDEGTTLRATAGYADPALGSDVMSRPAPSGDVHGLAAVCFGALAGVPPYRDESVDVAAKLGPLAPRAPAALVSAIEAGLAADPTERPDAMTFARAMFATCTPEVVRLTSPRQPTPAPPTHEVATGRRPTIAEPLATGTRTTRRRGRGWASTHPLMAKRVATVAGVAALLAAAVAGGVGWASHDHSAAAGQAAVAASAGTADAPVASSDDWVAILGGLDRTRDAAFVDADVGGLDRVYVASSHALATDRETLAGMVAAGERASGLHLRLVSVRPVSRSPADVTLAVRDTLPAYDVVRAGAVVGHHPGRGERSWTVVVHNDAVGHWLIASIGAA